MPPEAPTEAQLPAAARGHLASGRAELIYAPYHTSTWRLTRTSGAVLYLKAARVGRYPSLELERDRAVWLAAQGLPVPEVVDHAEGEGVEWLLTAELPGVAATDPAHLAEPERIVPLFAEGLRAFHELDVASCPFDWRLPVALDHVADRIARDDIDPTGFHDEHRHLSPVEGLEILRTTAPPDDDLVVSHGDYCLPNVLLDGDRVVGYLDLGEVGVAHRWRDLAVATWTCTWNVGPGYEDLFLAAYGAEWDLERRDFYRLLYDLES